MTLEKEITHLVLAPFPQAQFLEHFNKDLIRRDAFRRLYIQNTLNLIGELNELTVFFDERPLEELRDIFDEYVREESEIRKIYQLKSLKEERLKKGPNGLYLILVLDPRTLDQTLEEHFPVFYEKIKSELDLFPVGARVLYPSYSRKTRKNYSLNRDFCSLFEGRNPRMIHPSRGYEQQA